MADTPIQWADHTVNPVMGCDGCELWPSTTSLVGGVVKELDITIEGKEVEGVPSSLTKASTFAVVREAFAELDADELWIRREEIAREIAEKTSDTVGEVVLNHIKRSTTCYAAKLHAMRAPYNLGYAAKFLRPETFRGRTAKAAKAKDRLGLKRPAAPWLDGQPTLHFVNDMGDAMSKGVPFDFLKEEIIDVANSIEGRRHQWLWLTKRPGPMAVFSQWLYDKGTPWPWNLTPMTSVTDQGTTIRVRQLLEVRGPQVRGLSVEPLREAVTLSLDGIDWVIVGGESGSTARPFDLAWARSLRDQCGEAGVSYFVKQLGSNPIENGTALPLKDGHGGDWNEWPDDLRIRELPVTFRSIAYELRRRDGVEVAA